MPHLAFELAWRRQHLTIGLWVPGWVAFTRVQEIAAAEWPGAVTYWRDGHPLGSPPVLPDGHAAAGGELAVIGGQDWLPAS